MNPQMTQILADRTVPHSSADKSSSYYYHLCLSLYPRALVVSKTASRESTRTERRREVIASIGSRHLLTPGSLWT